jgi:hypothetical protein
MLMHSPSTPTTISVRFLFLIPLMLHTPVACMRPLLELTGFDSEARVNGTPISLSDDIVRACNATSVRVAVLGSFLAGTFLAAKPHLWLMARPRRKKVGLKRVACIIIESRRGRLDAFTSRFLVLTRSWFLQIVLHASVIFVCTI